MHSALCVNMNTFYWAYYQLWECCECGSTYILRRFSVLSDGSVDSYWHLCRLLLLQTLSLPSFMSTNWKTTHLPWTPGHRVLRPQALSLRRSCTQGHIPCTAILCLSSRLSGRKSLWNETSDLLKIEIKLPSKYRLFSCAFWRTLSKLAKTPKSHQILRSTWISSESHLSILHIGDQFFRQLSSLFYDTFNYKSQRVMPTNLASKFWGDMSLF